LEETCKRGKAQGQSCEHGIWLFLREAIDKKVHYDTIFIYSDMQAGHGGLYGQGINKADVHQNGGNYVDVLKMVDEYRSKVNPKVNVITTQVAGYNNSVVPENLYRGAILGGWTGKEALYASELISVWDEIETKVEVLSEQEVQA
jgi:hypothetical protein